MMKCEHLHGYQQIEDGKLKVSILLMLGTILHFKGTCYAMFFYLNHFVNLTAIEGSVTRVFYCFVI